MTLRFGALLFLLFVATATTVCARRHSKLDAMGLLEQQRRAVLANDDDVINTDDSSQPSCPSSAKAVSHFLNNEDASFCKAFFQSVPNVEMKLCISEDPLKRASGCTEGVSLKQAMERAKALAESKTEKVFLELNRLDGETKTMSTQKNPPNFKEAAKILACAVQFRACSPQEKNKGKLLPPCRPVQYDLPTSLAKENFWNHFDFEYISFSQNFGSNSRCFQYYLPLSTNYAVLLGAAPAKGDAKRTSNPLAFASVQIDICYVYKFLLVNGYPAENIIVLSFDDAYKPLKDKNMRARTKEGTKTTIKPDLCQEMNIDYSGEKFVEPITIKKVLKGESVDCSSKGSDSCNGRTLNKPDMKYSNLFVFYDGHGYDINFLFGFLRFSGLFFGSTEGATIYNVRPKVIGRTDLETLITTEMKFNQLVMYINSCHGGSLFEDWTQKLSQSGAYAFTATHATDSAYMFKDYTSKYPIDSNEVVTVLSTVFNALWMEDSMRSSLMSSTFDDQFNRIYQRGPLYPQYITKGPNKVDGSRATLKYIQTGQQFGSGSIRTAKLSTFFGFPLWTQWFPDSADFGQKIKFGACVKNQKAETYDFPEFETALEQFQKGLEKRIGNEKTTETEKKEFQQQLTYSKMATWQKVHGDAWKFTLSFVSGDVKEAVGGKRLSGVCQSNSKLFGTGSPADICKCMGYQEPSSISFDYAPLKKALAFADAEYEPKGQLSVELKDVQGIPVGTFFSNPDIKAVVGVGSKTMEFRSPNDNGKVVFTGSQAVSVDVARYVTVRLFYAGFFKTEIIGDGSISLPKAVKAGTLEETVVIKQPGSNDEEVTTDEEQQGQTTKIKVTVKLAFKAD